MRTSGRYPARSGFQELGGGARGNEPAGEQALIEKAKSGHSEAFGELYKRHHLQAFRTAFRIVRNQQDAEDATSRAFHRALVSLPRFRGDSNFSTWLTRITINQALMILRQRRAQLLVHETQTDAETQLACAQIPDGCPSPEEVLCRTERHATLHRAVAQLREKLKIVVILREMQGRTTAETAQILGLTVAAVKARTFHARRLIRKHFDRKFVPIDSLAFTRANNTLSRYSR
jgi:RNA polymerase sigma-70 factor (ECF subfamily)